jgi:hypothetical protein
MRIAAFDFIGRALGSIHDGAFEVEIFQIASIVSNEMPRV